MVAEVLALLEGLGLALALWYYRGQVRDARGLLEAERRANQTATAAAQALAAQQAAALKVLRQRQAEEASRDASTAKAAGRSADAAAELLRSLHKDH